MMEPGRRFVHANRWALDYASPTRYRQSLRHHHRWAGDLLFIVSFFACVLSGLFVVTLMAHFLFDSLRF